MKYPEEEIKIARTLDVLEYGVVQNIIAYAKWAHEQLRQRNPSEEPPPIGVPFLGSHFGSDEWVSCQLNDGQCAALLAINRWIHMPPPCEWPDTFERHWEESGEVGDAVEKAIAERAWQAALKWKEGK